MRRVIRAFLLVIVIVVFGVSSHAGGHTWRVKEFFSNADGTIQYVEVWESNGGAGETGTVNHNVTSNSNSFRIPSNVLAPASFKSLLFATQGFADLNVVTPDYIIVDNFFSVTADTIGYTPFPTVTFVVGQLPTDGVLALAANLTQVVNSPSNYAGDTGSVNLVETPPGVPATGLEPLRAGKSGGLQDGSILALNFDATTCTGNAGHQIVYGFGSGMPASPGGTLGVAGAVCSVGMSPMEWNGVPEPTDDPSGFLWFLMLATDGSDTEGSWGKDGSGGERVGPGINGSSIQCGMADKALDNTCGQ